LPTFHFSGKGTSTWERKPVSDKHPSNSIPDSAQLFNFTPGRNVNEGDLTAGTKESLCVLCPSVARKTEREAGWIRDYPLDIEKKRVASEASEPQGLSIGY
jgi:hypothetical protein